MKTFIKQKIRDILYVLLKILNFITPKDNKTIFFFPHPNCAIDNYDILNPLSDNVLCLYWEMLKDSRFRNYTFYLVVYNEKKIDSYKKVCSPYSDKKIIWVNFNNKLEFYLKYGKCKYIFSAETYWKHPTKTRSQKIFCLNYFSSFLKNDFYRFSSDGGFKRMIREQKWKYRIYDYHLSISDVCSKFIALDNCIFYSHMLPLGFPRNDVFFKDNSILRQELEKYVGHSFRYIFTYVPTHRDYENPDRGLYVGKINHHSIFGPCTVEDIEKLDNTLVACDAIIIAKVHPRQYRETLMAYDYKRVFFYQNIVEHIQTSLNPILAVSDFLITDYTTTVYDFMYADKPIIYYFYDYNEYVSSRGLFINPIEPFCFGEITYTIQDLINSIVSLSQGEDVFKEKRKYISELLIKDKDGKSSERIIEYFLKHIGC